MKYKVIQAHIGNAEQRINDLAIAGWRVHCISQSIHWITIIMIKESNAEKSV